MKRSRQGLLIQGSLDRSSLPGTLNFISFQNHLVDHLASILDLKLSELEDIRPLFKSERLSLKQRFASDAWNHRDDRASNFCFSKVNELDAVILGHNVNTRFGETLLNASRF